MADAPWREDPLAGVPRPPRWAALLRDPAPGRAAAAWPAPIRAAGAAAAMALMVVTGHGAGLNPPTAALLFQLCVLLLAAWLGTVAGVTASLVATAGLPYLLPPTGSWRIADPDNWVALGSFLVVTIVASGLVTRARQEALAERARQHELSALYRLSLELFAAVDRTSPRMLEAALEALGAGGGGIVAVEAGAGARTLSWSGTEAPAALSRALEAGLARQPLTDRTEGGTDVYLPLESGAAGRVLAVLGTGASLAAVESVAALVALALERERMLAETAHLAALRESDQLKTSLVRAISHDLATPLTALGLEIQALRRELAGNPQALERLAALEGDAARLERRVGNLLAMARIEAGKVEPRAEPVPAADLFRGVREHLRRVAAARPLEVRVDARCPDLWVDPSLGLEILVNLADNAHRASPAGAAIELVAEQAAPGRVRLEVRDRGPGLGGEVAAGEVALADVESRGLGLEIARTFATVSGGKLTIGNRHAGGALARLELPAAPAGAEEVGDGA